MKVIRKIPAGALQLVVFIGVIIAILLAAFVTLVYVNTKFSKQTDLVIKTIEQANQGIYLGLTESLPFQDTINLSSELSGIGDLKLYRNFWGIYETVTSVSTIKKNRIVNYAFVGNQSSVDNRTGLYLVEDNQPLVVVGNTHINGKNYIPKQGVKPGSVAGISYYGNQLIYGKVLESSESLPTLNSNLIDEVKRLQNILDVVDSKSIDQFGKDSVLKNSFKEEVKMFYALKSIYLSNVELVGHIILYSEEKITVNSSSKLTDIILIAPEIEIGADFRGNFQAIASEKITVGQNVTLEYPSSLVLFNSKTNTSKENFRSILISSNSVINGQVIVSLTENTNARFEPQLKLSEESTVFGEVYCNQNVEHLGEIKGSLYAKQFIAKQSGSIYINHIYNGRIDAKVLSEDYVGLLFEDLSSKGIMKWGY